MIQISKDKLYIAANLHKTEEKYWLNKFSSDFEKTNIPFDKVSDDNIVDYAILDFKFTNQQISKLKDLTNNSDVSLHVLFTATLSILLSKYVRNNSLSIGTTIQKKNNKETSINKYLPLKFEINYNTLFKEFLYYVGKVIHESESNQNYPIEVLIEKLELTVNKSDFPLFDITIINEKIHIKEFAFNTNPNLVFLSSNENGTINFKIYYNKNKYLESTILELGNYYIQVTENVIFNTSQSLKDISLLPEITENRIKIDFNSTNSEFPKGTILDLFSKQVEVSPNLPAVKFNKQSLTYKEFDERSNELSNHLIDLGVKSGDIVAIICERSIEMFVGIYAILKSGAAYLPISPNYPTKRITYALKDCNVKHILHNVKIDIEVEEIVKIDLLSIKLDNKDSHINSNKVNISSNQLAYVIYTSGTTGKPKGVAIEHHSLVNRLNWMQKKYPIGNNDVILHKTPFTFDVSVWEVFWWSMTGASVSIMRPEEEKDPEAIINEIIEGKITTMHFVPSMLNSFLHYLKEIKIDYSKLDCLKQVFASGEELKRTHVELFNDIISKNTNSQIINLYGPTEATIDVSYYNCPKEETICQVPIGKPIDNIKLFILDDCMNILPVGLPGELYISGIGLARGYINRVELTNEKFIKSPFEEGFFLYKTGDLAKWLPDGNIIFLKRIDSQVKIRGNRIELGEIEKALITLSEIHSAIVIALTDSKGHNFLCSYYIKSSNLSNDLDDTFFRKALSETLPDYMIPSFFIELKNFPTTLNGKLDIKNLPDPMANSGNLDNLLSPKTEIEKLLVDAWENVLSVNKIGINHNYFSLGGDSIKAIMIVSRIKRNGYNFNTKDLFNNPTIAELAKHVYKIDIMVDQTEVTGNIPLTPVQKEFFSKISIDRHHFNQAFFIQNERHFNAEVVKIVWQKLISHHDALRIRFEQKNDDIYQINEASNGIEIPLEIYNCDNESCNIQINSNQLQSSINLEKAPLFRLGLFKGKTSDSLLVVIHHLIIDMISWRILVQDFELLYDNVENKMGVELPLKSNSYKDWAIKFSSFYSETQNNENEIKFWNNVFSKKLDKIINDGPKGSKCISTIHKAFPNEMIEGFINVINTKINTNLYESIFITLALSLAAKFQINNFVVNVEGHGRDSISNDIDSTRTIGWFTSIYPVLISRTTGQNLNKELVEIKENLRSATQHGFSYGWIKHLIEFSNNNEPSQILFNFHGEVGADLSKYKYKIHQNNLGNLRSPRQNGFYEIEIAAAIIDKELRFSITYDKNQYAEVNMLSLIEEFKQTYQTILEFCIVSNDKQYSPSDFQATDLEIDEFEEIFE